MSKTPNFDQKLQPILNQLAPSERTCAMTGDKWFMDEEEISWFKRFNVPPSPYSRQVRLWHNAAFYTVFQWWWNKHFDTGEPVLTYVHPASGIRVLPDKEWFARDFSETNLGFSSERPFFEMFRELQLGVPINATKNAKEPENSIATISLGDTNSFFVSGCKSKNCLYTIDSEAEDVVDSSAAVNCSDGFSISHCSRLNRCQFVFESYDCLNSSFIFDCRNCENCFGATNQRNKKFLFFNKQLTEEKWREEMSKINLGSYQELESWKKKFVELVKAEAVWPESFSDQCQNVTGDYMNKSSNCVRCFYGQDAHDNYYCYGAYNAHGNAFSTAIPGDNNYQLAVGSGSSNCKFSASLMHCDDLEYSFNCYNCLHCFGCVGLSHKKFHIFNKEYSEEEYWQKVDELKCAMLDRGEYGRPIPMSFSFSYYPESGPVMYLGAKVEDWDKLGFKKFEASAEDAYGESRMAGKTIASVNDLPDDIKDLNPDEWLGRPIADPVTGRPYSLLKPEIEFYKKHNLAAPRKHFTSRILDLMMLMNTGWSENKKCTSCGKEIVVALNRTFMDKKAYCHECYLKYLEERN